MELKLEIRKERMWLFVVLFRVLQICFRKVSNRLNVGQSLIDPCTS